MVRVLHRWSVAKEVAEPHLNEDAAACAPRRGVYDVSDGASESFAAGRWAGILAHRFVRHPLINEHWLTQAITAYNKAFDRATMT
jgi:hypothetical protein